MQDNANKKKASVAKTDVLDSLIKANTKMANASDVIIFDHVSKCRNGRPCKDNPLCDVAKDKLRHFQQCKIRHCDTCAMARAIQAKEQGGNIALLQSSLIKARQQNAKASKAIRDATEGVNEAKELGGNIEALKAELKNLRNAYSIAKSSLAGVCGQIYDEWVRTTGHQSEPESFSKANSISSPLGEQVAQTPPKEAGTQNPSTKPKFRSPGATGDSSSQSSTTTEADVLMNLVRAQTQLATADDISLLEHVTACSRERPCAEHPSCDIGKERLEHYRTCQSRTCGTCAMARLIEAIDKNRPIADLQQPLLQAKTIWRQAFTGIKSAVDAFISAKHKLGGLAEAESLRPAMEEAKRVHETAKREYESLCSQVFDEWNRARQEQAAAQRLVSPSKARSNENEHRQIDSRESPLGQQHQSENGGQEIDRSVASREIYDAQTQDMDATQVARTQDMEATKVAAQTTATETTEAFFPDDEREDSAIRFSPEIESAVAEEALQSIRSSPSILDELTFNQESLLVRLASARTSKASADDSLLMEHVLNCSNQRPCGANALCDDAKTAWQHFVDCSSMTCVSCAMSRLILTQENDASVASLELPLVRAKTALREARQKLRRVSDGAANTDSATTALLLELRDDVQRAQGACNFLSEEIFRAWSSQANVQRQATSNSTSDLFGSPRIADADASSAIPKFLMRDSNSDKEESPKRLTRDRVASSPFVRDFGTPLSTTIIPSPLISKVRLSTATTSTSINAKFTALMARKVTKESSGSSEEAMHARPQSSSDEWSSIPTPMDDFTDADATADSGGIRIAGKHIQSHKRRREESHSDASVSSASSPRDAMRAISSPSNASALFPSLPSASPLLPASRGNTNSSGDLASEISAEGVLAARSSSDQPRVLRQVRLIRSSSDSSVFLNAHHPMARASPHSLMRGASDLSSGDIPPGRSSSAALSEVSEGVLTIGSGLTSALPFLRATPRYASQADDFSTSKPSFMDPNANASEKANATDGESFTNGNATARIRAASSTDDMYVDVSVDDSKGAERSSSSAAQATTERPKEAMTGDALNGRMDRKRRHSSEETAPFKKRPQRSAAKDVLSFLVKAGTKFSSKDDVELKTHVTNCSNERPCPFPDCDMAKKRLEHFRTCQSPTCMVCVVARMIAAMDKGASLSHLQTPLLKERVALNVANENVTAASHRFMEAKDGDAGDVNKLNECKRALERAKAEQHSSKLRMDKICIEVYNEWTRMHSPRL